jgi:hypothetical protein
MIWHILGGFGFAAICIGVIAVGAWTSRQPIDDYPSENGDGEDR